MKYPKTRTIPRGRDVPGAPGLIVQSSLRPNGRDVFFFGDLRTISPKIAGQAARVRLVRKNGEWVAAPQRPPGRPRLSSTRDRPERPVFDPLLPGESRRFKLREALAFLFRRSDLRIERRKSGDDLAITVTLDDPPKPG